MTKISVVLNSLNEQENIKRAIESVKWADEIVVCDMHSDDKTVEVAKKLGAKVIYHERLDYVEPARNFAVSKAKNPWILVLDPDEEIPLTLGVKLQELANGDKADFVKIARKNLIFGSWMKASMWWPDRNVRFFKKGSVTWSEKIHFEPRTFGEGLELPAEEVYAILHHHYESISQFIERMDRYTSVQARNLKEEGYNFEWKDLVRRPLSEFLGRFFANRGFEDGLHGLALGLLQAFSFLVVYLKVWEMEKFEREEITLPELKKLSDESGKELKYWFKYGNLAKNPVKRFFQKAKAKLN